MCDGPDGRCSGPIVFGPLPRRCSKCGGTTPLCACFMEAVKVIRLAPPGPRAKVFTFNGVDVEDEILG